MLVRETECRDGDVIWSWNSVEEARDSGRFDYQFEDDRCLWGKDKEYQEWVMQVEKELEEEGVAYLKYDTEEPEVIAPNEWNEYDDEDKKVWFREFLYDEYNTFSGTLLQFLDKFADKGIFHW